MINKNDPLIEFYIHIPFCVRKCSYCDFLSFPAEKEQQEAYVRELCREIEAFPMEGRRLDTVFFGGGTPSILPAEAIREICEVIRKKVKPEEAIREWTIECNPGTLDAEKLLIYRECGINRLSLGLQSADNKELQLLGRIHTWEKFCDSFRLAREAGFSNINVDLMSALPGQSRESWQETLQKVTALDPTHISAYSLIIEEGTPFYERYGEEDRARAAGEDTILLPSEEEERLMYEDTARLLGERGYHRYEISNYARQGYACIHNLGYWKRREYKGFGLGAVSLLGNVRSKNTDVMQRYLAGSWQGEEQEILTRQDCIAETMILGLRLTEGVRREAFRAAFGIEPEAVYRSVIEKYEKLGLLQRDEERICLTAKGMDLSNLVMSEFLFP